MHQDGKYTQQGLSQLMFYGMLGLVAVVGGLMVYKYYYKGNGRVTNSSYATAFTY
ncbi:hypothetical protein [Largemouth bass virus]|nr:hypothetical protein [Mandarin fish ranavirus]WEI29031.1 hypothetical protein [Largemouth bass virus]WHA35493.1 hypothetical protein MSRaV_5R [Micropterus salmoides ranavirus]WHA35598.1 hypothetical protein SCRaV_5R [Siniperca chuatsi ranavirus]